jgi:hypothetical protein
MIQTITADKLTLSDLEQQFRLQQISWDCWARS